MCTNLRCLYPIPGFSKNGKQNYTFSERNARKYNHGLADPILIPCGACLECRMDKARKFAVRCVNEAELHEHNAFITLTYNDFYVTHEILYFHFQNFIKRLRQDIKRHHNYYNGDVKIRYVACGEHGDISGRVHFHALIFGIDWRDKEFYKNGNGYTVWKSPRLEKMWRRGFCTISDVNFATAQYVAGYIFKRSKTECDNDDYLVPEKVLRSVRPGIGLEWWKKYYKSNVYRGYMLCKNKEKIFKVGIPRYYIQHLKNIDPDAYQYYVDKFGGLTYYSDYLEDLFRGNVEPSQDDARENYLVYMNNQITRDIDVQGNP